MKTKKLLKLIGIFIIGFTMLTSCSSDDNNNNDDNLDNSNNSSLFDKWWFDSNNVTADIYFHTDGEYEQRIVLLDNEITGSGNWTWEDESAGIMKIDNLGGNGQIFSSVFFKFSDISSSTMTLQQSTNGTDYSIEVFYQDTDN